MTWQGGVNVAEVTLTGQSFSERRRLSGDTPFYAGVHTVLRRPANKLILD
jgi:hypothetical protein